MADAPTPGKRREKKKEGTRLAVDGSFPTIRNRSAGKRKEKTWGNLAMAFVAKSRFPWIRDSPFRFPLPLPDIRALTRTRTPLCHTPAQKDRQTGRQTGLSESRLALSPLDGMLCCHCTVPAGLVLLCLPALFPLSPSAPAHNVARVLSDDPPRCCCRRRRGD